MCLVYMLMAIGIIVIYYQNIPSTIALVFKSAFGADAVFGGIVGSAIAWGVKRGVYSTEAGQGSADKFVLVEDEPEDGLSKEEKDNLQSLLFNVSYGLYIISSKDGDKINGMTSNSFIQITDTPLRGSVCINKGTRTAEMIEKSGQRVLGCVVYFYLALFHIITLNP